MKAIRFSVLIFLSVVSFLCADEIYLKNGDVLNVEILSETDNNLVVKHVVLGELVISKVDLAKKTPEPKPVISAQADEPDYLFKNDFKFGYLENLSARIKENGWEMKFNFSLNGSDGNTQEQAWRIGYGAKKIEDSSRIIFNSTYYKKLSDGNSSDNKLMATLRKDWLRSESRWFFFAQGRYDYDEFNSWSQRFAAEIGPGYHLIENELTQLDLLFGVGARRELGSSVDSLKYEFAPELDLDWQLSPRQTFSSNISLRPNICDSSDYRTLSSLNWRYLLDKELNLSLNLGLEHEYQAVVEADRKKSDTRFFTGLQFDF